MPDESDVTDLARRIAELPSEQRARLEQMLMKPGATDERGAILRRSSTAPCPLSFAQQRLWFLDQLDPGSHVYNVAKAHRLRGRLDVAALQRALNAILARHEALRTTFLAGPGEPVQVVAPSRTLALATVDASDLPLEGREAAMRGLLDEHARRPFDLSRDTMLRATLFQLGAEDHILLVVMHHIASDGWSMGILWRDLASLYSAFSRGEPPDLAPLPIQYADYSLWQRERLQGARLEEQLSYWRQHLGGDLPVLALPADHPRPATPTYRGAAQYLMLPAGLFQALRDLGRHEGCSAYMTLLAAFQALLQRYTGRDDIVVGSPIAGRVRVETEGLIGFFVNTLVLRTDLSGSPTFREALRRVRRVALDAFDHQEVPFEKLVEELRPERNIGQSPLFQVMFALQNASTQAMHLPGLIVEPVRLNHATAKFDLSLSLFEEAEGLRVRLEYSTDLFTPATITRLQGHFQTLLEGIVAGPDQPITSLRLLTPAERQRLLVDWSATSTPYPREASVQQLFEEQAARTPDAVAVAHEDEHLTYRDLNERANRLARYLRRRGVRRGALVGICVERSLAMVVGTLGILKAGGGYVPLDPAYPTERLATILEDAGLALVLTQERLRDHLPRRAAAVIPLDSGWDEIAGERDENPPNETEAAEPAYVMYTSGSTGAPKGVIVPHRAIIRLVRMTNYIQLKPEDVVAQVASCSFDAATFEIWGALLNGARLVILDRDVVLAPDEFARRLRTEQVSAMFLTTALFNLMAREAPRAFAPLKHVLFGGEAADAHWVAEVLRQGPPQRLLNVYGPTENTTFTTWQLVEAAPDGARTVPIGRPIANTEVYLLDGHGEPTPVGIPGELYLGGDGLSLGYLGRPALTAERFVAHPFRADPRARLYRTGDQGRYLPDGSIEFLGRLDEQVKIRGFRIEPAEVELALKAHPGVRDAVVVVREDEPGEKRLVAYVVAHQQETAPAPMALRDFVKRQLPAFMVPSAFQPIPALPLTANGKVDRRALPRPEATHQQPGRTFVAPRDEVERQLTALWEAVLGVQPIGVRDNFFDLGGHSLLATSLFARIERVFGKPLPLSVLFGEGTIEHLAEQLRQVPGPAMRSPLVVTIQAGGAEPPFFCIHTATGSLLLYRDLARHLGAERPFYGIQGEEPTGKRPPTIEEMASRYVQAIRTVQPQGPYYLGGFCFAGVVAFEMARQLEAMGQRVALLALFESALPGSGRLLPLGQRLQYHLRRLWQLSLGEKLTYLRDRARNLRWRAKKRLWKAAYQELPTIGVTMPRAMQESAGANFVALRDFRPQAYGGKITLFRAADEARWFYRNDPQRGWQGVASRGVELHEVAGTHGSMLKEPYVAALAAMLSACLREAERDALQDRLDGSVGISEDS